MKKPKIVGYIHQGYNDDLPKTFVVGSYKTQCGGCDSMSYKGSHEDIETLVREQGKLGNVVFEGLTISSTLSRWRRIEDEYEDFAWAFMMTAEEECYNRIMARNGGREPKRNNKGLADYQIKYRGCMKHMEVLRQEERNVVELTSDDTGYEKFKELLIASSSPH
jgi:hypothetical protein